jgi:hypothetical protein
MPASAGNALLQGTDAREALLCARLSLRGAKRLLQNGSLQRGMSAPYDSVLFGMCYCPARRSDCAKFDPGDAGEVFQELARQEIFEDRHAFNRLSLTVERTLWQGASPLDSNAIVVEVEEMLKKLGVLSRQSVHAEKQINRAARKEGDAYLNTA